MTRHFCTWRTWHGLHATTCTNSGLQALLNDCNIAVSAALMLSMLRSTAVCIRI